MGLELIDLREDPKKEPAKMHEPGRIGWSVYWSRRNPNYLMHDRLNTVQQFDIRNKSSIMVGDFGMGHDIERIRMNPQETFLLTWLLEQHIVHMCHCDESQSWDNAKYLNRFEFVP